MKKINIMIALTIAVLAISCSKSSEPLTGLIVYDVVVNNHDKMCDPCNEDITPLWFVNNVEVSQRNYFLNTLFNAVLDGKIKVLDNKLVDGKYDFLLTDSLAAQLQMDKNTLYIAVDKIIEQLSVNDSINSNCPAIRPYNAMRSAELGARDVVAIRFCEKWSYDSTNMEIKKEIIAYAPLLHLSDPQRPWKRVKDPQPVFWVVQDANEKANALITDNIMYNVPFNGGSCVYNENPEQLESYMKSVNQWVLEDSIMKIRVWNWWARPDSVVAFKNLKALPFADPNAGKAVRVFPKNNKTVECSELDGLFFVEEWAMNPATLGMSKTITRMGVIAKFYKPDGATKEFFPVCLLKYGESSKKEKE